MSNRIICGDCLKILPTLPKATMIFADPPDNLGVKYAGVSDKMPDWDYIRWLQKILRYGDRYSDIFWLSYYHKYMTAVLGHVWEECEWRQFIWRFTFGQHRHTDCGNGYRPILRLMHPNAKLYPDAIRVESARQKLGDRRADPRGRVPDDVWDFSRVCGTFNERRKWHPNQHPEALIERIVLFSTKPGDLVIDMFGGTFTAARVCKRLGRNCISIEISEEYCEKGRAELNELQSKSV